MTHEEFETIAALEAAGAAEPDEMRSLDEHARDCADCRRARDEFAEASALMAKSLDPVSPPPELKDQIVDAVDDSDNRDDGGRSHVWWLATAATLFLAMWGWREIGVRVLRERSASQVAEIKQLTDTNRVLVLQRDKLTSEMAALGAFGTKTIALAGQQVAPAASARVFLDTEKRRAIVFFSELPVVPDDKSYQLWVIRADQAQPQSAGVFEVSKGSAVITIENLPVATAIKGLAVTLERHGGSDQPTSTNYYVSGSV